MRKLDNITKNYQSFPPKMFMHTKCEIKYDPKGVVLIQGWQKAGFYSYCPGRRLLPAFTGYYRLLLALSSNPLLCSIIMPNRNIII